jgi:hypothetical protein
MPSVGTVEPNPILFLYLFYKRAMMQTVLSCPALIVCCLPTATGQLTRTEPLNRNRVHLCSLPAYHHRRLYSNIKQGVITFLSFPTQSLYSMPTPHFWKYGKFWCFLFEVEVEIFTNPHMRHFFSGISVY